MQPESSFSFRLFFDEAAAFASQWAFSPESVNGLNPTQPITTIADITPAWVTGIMDIHGAFPYGPEGEFKVGQTDITVSSLGIKIQKAYFWVNKKEFAGWRWKSMKAKYKDNLYYKK